MVKIREQGEGLLWDWPVCPDSVEGKMCKCFLWTLQKKLSQRRLLERQDRHRRKTGEGLCDEDRGAFLGGTNGGTGIP